MYTECDIYLPSFFTFNKSQELVNLAYLGKLLFLVV